MRNHEDLCGGWQDDLTPDLADEETLAPGGNRENQGDISIHTQPSRRK